MATLASNPAPCATVLCAQDNLGYNPDDPWGLGLSPIGAFYEGITLANDLAPSITDKTHVLLDANNQGFSIAALTARDANLDGQLTGAELNGLSLWGDTNEDGHMAPGELQTTAQANIIQINSADYRFYTGGTGEGTDTVQSSISYTLGTNVENLNLTGTAAINGTGNFFGNILTGNDDVNVLAGGGGADTLYGNAGNDTLDGGLGADTLVGGAGDDTYYLDDLGDIARDAAMGGTDTVYSTVSYSLGPYYTEHLTLLGVAAIDGTGNGAANTLTGNSANNTLNGGGGLDTLIGGLGDDTYVVDRTGDIVTELAGEGIDTVKSSTTYTLSANVEHLTLTGTLAVNGTGNADNNTLTGNAANNILNGMVGDDTLSGLGGNDTLNGGGGNDTLNGGAGNDALLGGAGNDLYQFGRNHAADTLTDTGGVDTLSMISPVNYDQLWFTHVGNDLRIDLIGRTDNITVTNWYLGAANQVETIQAGGLTLSNANVENLVQAMAAFAPPSAGQTTFTALPANYQTALSPVIAANWV